MSWLLASGVHAAGEMKDCPIALLEGATPVVAVAAPSRVERKWLSNPQELRADGAAVTVGGDRDEAIQLAR